MSRNNSTQTSVNSRSGRKRVLTSDSSGTPSEEPRNFLLAKKIELRRSSSFPVLSVDFADNYSFWIYYLFIILIVRYVFFLVESIIPNGYLWPAWTIVNIMHSLVFFIYLFIYLLMNLFIY